MTPAAARLGFCRGEQLSLHLHGDALTAHNALAT